MNRTYLYHHGILGMKWGIRRYQNKDGTLTEEGKRRYTNYDGSLTDKARKDFFEGNTSKLSRQGNDVIRGHGKDSEIGKAVRSEQFGRQYEERWLDSYSKAADQMNNGKLQEINKKYEKYDVAPREYYEEMGKVWKDTYKNILLKDFGDHPAVGEEWVNAAFFYDMYDNIDEWMV